MRTFWRRWWAGVALATVLAGCGGGDGGEEANEPTVVLDAPGRLQGEAYQGGFSLKATFTGHMTGNLQAVSGNIYVVIEDTAGVFNPTPEVAPSMSVTNGLDVTLTGRTGAAAGRKTGNVRVFVCRDLACKSQYRGSPLQVPYDITVRPGLALSTNEVRVEVPFTQQAQRTTFQQTVGVTVAPSVPSWQFNAYLQFDPVLPIEAVHRVVSATTGEIDVTVGADLLPPGTYFRPFGLQATMALPNGQPLPLYQDLRVLYVVTPEPSVSHVLPATGFNFTHSWFESSKYQPFKGPVLNTGASISDVRVEYLSHPAAAAGNGNVNSWFYRTNAYSMTSLCAGSAFPGNCLPAGRYEARVAFDIQYMGTTTTVYQGVTLDVLY